MAQRCFGHSRANAWPPFTIAVVDAGGVLVSLRRQDGASPVTAEAALLKARTASRSGAPTQGLAAMSQDAPTRDLMLLLQLTDDPGGVPVKSAGRVIGAIGVSGGTADQDMGCANLAIGAWTGEKK
jgi:glc operon protein GlcG